MNDFDSNAYCKYSIPLTRSSLNWQTPSILWKDKQERKLRREIKSKRLWPIRTT